MSDLDNSPTLNPTGRPEPRKFSFVTIVFSVIIIVAIAVSLWFLFQPPTPNRLVTVKETVLLSLGSAEQDYAKNIQFEKINLTREANGLGQEVTTLHGEVSNTGSRSVAEIMLTVQFDDTMNQIVLRETRRVVGVRAVPLAAGQTRPFEIAFDNIPDSWNMRQPSLRIVGIQFATLK